MDALFPARCVICGAAARGLLCPSCREGCDGPAEANRCGVCGMPLPSFLERCARCRDVSFAFDGAVAAHRHAGCPARVVAAYKFGRRVGLAGFMAAGMAAVTPVLPCAVNGAVVVPVPSRRGSIRRRGFASAEPLARELSRLLSLPYLRLLRHEGRKSQKTLALDARLANAASGLRALSSAPVPAVTLLVDDVFTTGSTASACAAILKSLGARNVFVLTWAMEY